VQLITFSHGDRQLLQLSLQDITRRKQAEREKEKLHQQLMQSQKMESVGRLAGGVAHDFNNMLSVILGHTELALERTSADHPLYDRLKNIQEAAQRSADLTRQLLAFARKQTVVPRVLDINATVAGLLNMLERLIGENIVLLWQPGADISSIRVDPSQIDQLLVNLCVNARDAIEDNGTITIATAAVTLDKVYCAEHPGAVPGEYVALTVSDNGSGMSPETLSHLFEPFFTTKEVGKGTGLGLATVYGIVKQNDGFIAVDSKPERGTTFQIFFPRLDDATESAEENQQPTTATLGHETILLVEDGDMMLDITSTMLTILGYTVLPANSPAEAHKLAGEHAGKIQLLITDVIMPTMNGRELASSLQGLYPGLKCLFMSGYTANVIAHHGVLDKGVHFLAKPFTMKDLATKVRETLTANS
jgi:two-component system, cell cycle sensor histidine kinase and response regulator CckA